MTAMVLAVCSGLGGDLKVFEGPRGLVDKNGPNYA